MIKNIAVLFGGDSSEAIVSERSAAQISEYLENTDFNIFKINVRGNQWVYSGDVNKNYYFDLNQFELVAEKKKRIKLDYAFIIIHGTPGEDGKIQALLDMHSIPYNTPGVFTSCLTFNKYACKLYLKNFGILTPESIIYRKGDPIKENEMIEKTGLPCFIKPNNGGSSFGTTKVKNKEEVVPAISEALKEDPEVIIESFVKGVELSCGLLKTHEEEYVFPVTEIVPANDFFDYESKYTEGMAEEIVPARVDEEIQKKCQLISSSIYDILGCKGLVRMDYILKGNQIFFLEVNTIPGMSRESIVPKMIRAAGYQETDILKKIIEDTNSR